LWTMLWLLAVAALGRITRLARWGRITLALRWTLRYERYQ
jgi:hypothetical protein